MHQMVSLLTDLKIKVSSETWAKVMNACTKGHRCKLAEDLFGIMIESGVEPTPHSWTALVTSKAHGIILMLKY